MDFDATQRERQHREESPTFTLRGETFRVRNVVPFATLGILAGIGTDATDRDAFTAVEKVVLSLIPREDHERFLRVIYDADADFPVTYQDMLEIQNFLIREASGRPPTRLASSSESPSRNGQSETGASSPTPAEA